MLLALILISWYAIGITGLAFWMYTEILHEESLEFSSLYLPLGFGICGPITWIVGFIQYRKRQAPWI